MAARILRLNHHEKSVSLLVLFSLVLLIQKCSATEFKVGGSGAWTVPTDPNAPHYNQWAERNRFQIGDSLVFDYPADKDSVLLVSMEDYTNCNTGTYVNKFTDGHTVFDFNHSGPFYFVSGNEDNCLKNEKMVVVVMADRSNNNQTNAASPPSPSPSAEISPSPAPATESAPPPPPATFEIVPSPPPTSEQSHPKKNGASSVIIGFVASFGAFIGSSLLLLS